MNLKVQAQHLQPGDIVGSGEVVQSTIINSIHWPSNKVWVVLERGLISSGRQWGKYTLITVERAEKEKV